MRWTQMELDATPVTVIYAILFRQEAMAQAQESEIKRNAQKGGKEKWKRMNGKSER